MSLSTIQSNCFLPQSSTPEALNPEALNTIMFLFGPMLLSASQAGQRHAKHRGGHDSASGLSWEPETAGDVLVKELTGSIGLMVGYAWVFQNMF